MTEPILEKDQACQSHLGGDQHKTGGMGFFFGPRKCWGVEGHLLSAPGGNSVPGELPIS